MAVEDSLVFVAVLRVERLPFDIAVSGRIGARLAGVGSVGDGGETPGDVIGSNGAALLSDELGRESNPFSECSSLRNNRGNVSGKTVRKSLVAVAGVSVSLLGCLLSALRFVSCVIRRCQMSRLSWQCVAKRVNSTRKSNPPNRSYTMGINSRGTADATSANKG